MIVRIDFLQKAVQRRCRDCEGTGRIHDSQEHNRPYVVTLVCGRCDGRGHTKETKETTP